MNRKLLLVAVLALSACSRNPDPEYSPDADDDAVTVAAAPTTQADVAAPTGPAVTAPAPTALSDDDAYRLGREAAALLFANDMAGLWTRFDANVQAQAQSAENFGQMVGQVFAQTGVEGTMVEESIERDPGTPGLTIYRRRGTYLAIGADLNLIVALNADGTIAGINIQPIE